MTNLEREGTNALTLLTIPKAAELLGVSRNSIEDMLKDPDFPRIFIGVSNQTRIPAKAMIDYVNKRALNWPQYTTGL